MGKSNKETIEVTESFSVAIEAARTLWKYHHSVPMVGKMKLTAESHDVGLISRLFVKRRFEISVCGSQGHALEAIIIIQRIVSEKGVTIKEWYPVSAQYSIAGPYSNYSDYCQYYFSSDWPK